VYILYITPLVPFYTHSIIHNPLLSIFLLGYGFGQKGYRCFDPVSKKLYVLRHVVCLEHISFFSILASSHYLTTYDVIKIGPFDIDTTTPTPVMMIVSK